MKCTNCGATVTPDEVSGGACKFCGAALSVAAPAAPAAPVGTVGAQVDQLLASLGVQPGTPAMTQIQEVLRAQQSHVVDGVTYRTLVDMPLEVRKAFMLSLLARQAAMMRAREASGEAMGDQLGVALAARPRRRSGCGCFPVFLLLLLGAAYAYYYYYWSR